MKKTRPLLLYYRDTLPDGRTVTFQCEISDHTNLRPEDAKAITLFKWDILRYFPEYNTCLMDLIPEYRVFGRTCGLCEFNVRYQHDDCTHCALTKLNQECDMITSLYRRFCRNDGALHSIANKLYDLIASIDMNNYYIADRKKKKK